jgi:hypothetical protein
MGEVVNEHAGFRRRIAPGVGAPGALLFFSQELTGPFDLGINRREWERVHGIAASTELSCHIRRPISME